MQKWIKIIVCSLIIWLAATPITSTKAAGLSGLSKEKLTKIESYVKEQFAIAGFPGGSYAVIEQGDIVLAQGIGFSDLATKRKATPETIYATASVTKPLTAAAVLKLVDQGILAMDTPITTYLPWFQYKDKDQSSKVTIRHLLTHSAGVNRFAADGAIYQDIKNNRNSRENTIRNLQTVKMNSEPGSKGQYCNTCFNILGLIIEEVTGQPYETYMRDQIFHPLGMIHTDFAPVELKNADIAKEYGYMFGFPREVAPYWQEFGSSQAPEGGAYSSATDLARFVAAALGYRDDPFFTAGIIHEHNQTGVVASDLSNAIYTEAGFEAKVIGGTKVYMKSGEGMGSSSEIVLIPSLNAGIVLLIGESDGEACGRIAEGIVNMMLEQEPGSVKGLMNVLQVIGWISLGILSISVVLVLWVIWSFLRLRRARYAIKRTWTVIGRLFFYGILSVPIWYMLLVFRPTEAGFYGYPYDLAIALVSLVIALSLWTTYSGFILIMRQNYRNETLK